MHFRGLVCAWFMGRALPAEPPPSPRDYILCFPAFRTCPSPSGRRSSRTSASTSRDSSSICCLLPAACCVASRHRGASVTGMARPMSSHSSNRMCRSRGAATRRRSRRPSRHSRPSPRPSAVTCHIRKALRADPRCCVGMGAECCVLHPSAAAFPIWQVIWWRWGRSDPMAPCSNTRTWRSTT